MMAETLPFRFFDSMCAENRKCICVYMRVHINVLFSLMAVHRFSFMCACLQSPLTPCPPVSSLAAFFRCNIEEAVSAACRGGPMQRGVAGAVWPDKLEGELS